MQTAYEIGDQVLIRANVESITVTPMNEIVYALSIVTAQGIPDENVEVFE